MSPDNKNRFLRSAALFTLVTFSFQQVSSAQTLQNDIPGTSISYEKTAQSDAESGRFLPDSLLPGQGQKLSSFDFLQQERTLWNEESVAMPADIVSDSSEPETSEGTLLDQRAERSTFEDALAELRPEYASAVILESLSEENIKQLLDLDFEVAVVILAGEIVLLTSGNEDEILTSKPAARILEAAAFTAHTHPKASHIEGPSPLDLKNASGREYVLTDQSAYAYDLFDVEELSVAQFLSEFEAALHRERARYKQNSVMARQQLNRFIKEMDLLNEIQAEAVVFRASEPPLVNPPVPVRVYSAARMAGNFVSIYVNNQSVLTSVGRGFNLAVIDESTGQVLETRTFDTFASQAQSDAMAAFIEGLPQGRYVAVVVHDEGSNSLNQRAKDALKTLGAMDVQNLGWQQSYSLLGRKGLQPGEGMEKRETGNWMALVDAVPYVPSFPENYNVTFQAEHMGGISGWISWSDRWLNTNGMIYKQWQVPQPGGFDLEVVAKGTSEGNVWPLMEVRLNGQVIAGPVSVSQGGYTSYHFTGIPVSAGLHELQIVYTNDQGNRNLAVDRMVIKKSAGSVVQPPSAPTVQSLPAFTNQSTLTLSGSKPAGTSVWINGVERVPASVATSWSYNQSLAAGDGVKNFSILAKDSAGTPSGSVNASITLDQTLPSGSLSLQAGAAYTSSTAVTAALTASDALAGLDQVRYQVNGVWSAWTSFSSTKSITLPAGDNTKTVRYEIRDRAGNVRQLSDTILLDTVAPMLNLSVNAGHAYTNALLVYAALTASDAGSGLYQMRHQIGGGAWSAWTAYAASTQVTLSAGDGSKQIRFEVKDRASNVSSAVTSVTLDTAAPAIIIQSPAIGSDPFVIQESQITIQYTVDGQPKTKQFASLLTGDNPLSIQETDLAGNTTTRNFTIRVVPNVVVGAPTVSTLPAFTNQSSLTLTGTKQAGTSIWINGIEGIPANASTSWSYNDVLTEGDGLKSFSILAKDSAGNTSGSVNISTTLDQTLPAGSVLLYAGAAYTASDSITAALTASDAVSGLDQVRYQVNGVWSAWESFTSSKSLTLNGEDGTKTVLYEVRDKAGNVRQASDTIVLDTTAPAFTLIVNGGNTHTNALTVTVALTASDAGSGLHQMRYQIAGGAWSAWENYAASKEVTLPAGDGSKEIRFELRDNAGNVQAEVSSVTLDTVAPVLATDSMYFHAQTAESGLGGYWSFDDLAGTSTEDGSGNSNHGILVNGPVTSADYPPLTSGNHGSLQFDGVNDYVTTSTKIAAPQEFTISLWFKATGAGGRLIGFGNNQTGDSTGMDRHVFMGNWGHLYFSVYSGGIQMIQSPQGYNDGQWHFLTASMSASGMALYVDGQLKAQKTNITSAGNYEGYWRLGGDNLYSWWNRPYNYYFKGNMDEARVYNRQLSLQEIQTLAQGGVLGSAVPPSAIQSDSLTVSYKLDSLSKSKTFSGLQQGENQIRISETDEAGNNTTLIGTVTVNLSNQSVLPDGTQLFRSSGILQKEITPWGDEIFYRADGSVEKYRFADGREIHYSLGNVNAILFYNAQGVLEETLNPPAAPPSRDNNWVRVGLTGGLSAFYEGQALMEILTETGIRITNVSFDDSGSMKDAFLFYPDGTMDIIRGSKRIRHIGADHSILDYLPSGGAVREIFSDHTDFYHFTKVSQEEILRTYVKSSTGSVTVYDDRGLLSEVRQGELVLYYDRQPDGAAFRLYLNKGISSAPDTKTMIEGSFDSDGTPLWIALKDGTRIYYQSGRLDRVVDSLGVTIDYDFETSGGFVKELTVSRGGASFKYASDGFLQKIETSSGVVTRSAEDADQDGKLTDEQIVEILLDETGGNRLTDFELDPDGNILNGIIITKEGIKQKIENGILTGYETVDGKLYKFHTGENGIQQAELIEWKFRDGTRAIYGGGSISSILFPDGRSLNALGFGADRSLKTYVEESADGTRKNFENGKLKQIFTVSGAVIDFGLDGMAYKVTFADGEAQGIRYLKDPAGTLTEIVFEGSYARRSFGPEGDLLAVLTDGVRAELDNGVLERLFTRYGSVNHPEFNDAGLLSGDILFADGIKQSIRDGLLDSLSLAGGAVINYSEGRIVDLTASEGVYRVHYTDQGAALENATLEFNGGGVSWTKPLIPYLVDHPDSDLARLLLSRALHNALHEREEVQSSFETGDTLFFARLIPDSERGDVYGFGIDYLPYWSGMDMANGYDYSGAVQTSRTLNSWLDAPSQISMLEDINGDGLADRILLAAPGMNYWWVQLNSGQGFLSAVKWTGVDASFNEGALHYQDLLPRIFGTLIDINGDGLPDRVLQSFDGSPEWKIQFNNGSGFNPAVLWGGTAHALQQPSPESRFASEVWEDQGFQIAALTDLDGDGLPDRVLRPYVAPFDRWFWQKNLGDGFADALLWEGVSSSFNQDPKKAASLSGYAEVENNFETPAAAAIRQKLAEWDQSIAHYNTACGNLSGSALHSCRSSAGSLMFSAAQRIQDTIRDYGASYYAAYMDDPGVEFYSLQDYERYKNAALYAIRLFQTGFADTNALMDLNGDGLPDRVLLKPKPGQSVAGAQEWWWQKNTGEDFEPAVLWDADVRALPGAPTAQAATSIRYVPGWLLYRDTLIDLTDVNGDGLPDRVTMDRHGAVSQTHTSWWVEVNTGSGFSPAVEWPGIYGDASAQTSIQNDMTRFRHVAWGAYGPQMRQMSAFKDISGDGIPDRVLFEPGASHWKVQLGTGTGFLPVEEILIEALSAPAEVNTSRYDYLHVSLKSDIPLTASLGHIKVTLGDPSEPESYQEWMIQDTGPAWKDYFLPINSAMANADQVHIEYIPAASQSSVPVYVDNLTFTALRPPAEKDWLDRLLAEENVLTEVYSDRNETLAGYLGYLENGTESEPLSPSLLESLMNAETRLEFDAGGSLREFETLYGSVSQVENGRVSETILPNGNKIEFSAPEDQHPQTTTRTVTDSGGQTMIQELSYGRVRHVTRSGKPPLQYSYEFDSLGREITVIFDPDTGVTERYQDIAGQSRIVSRAEANGVITVFKHDSAGERTSADVMYKGRVYETYIYGSSEEGLMTVTTDSGVVEEYDAEGKIRFHTTADGYRYAHSFEKARNVEMSYETEIETLPDQTVINVQIPVVSLTVCETNCEDVHRVSLTGFTAEDGTEASYQDGDLTSLKYPDGTRVFFTRTTVNERTNPETGEILPELLLMDALLVHTDGTSTEYRNGKPYAVKKTNGQSILLETEKGLFINPHESAVFHHAQALKLWGDFVKPQWNEFIAPGSLALEIDYDGEGHVVTRRYAEGVTEVYEDGRILMTVGAQGERLTRYDYDAEGNPVRIELEASRRRLASAVLELRTEVALERQKALAKLAEREQVLNQTIEGEYIVQRDRLLAIKARIEAQRDKIATLKVKGKAAKAAIGDASQQIQAGLDQVNAALEKLAQNRIDALEQLSSQVEDTSDEIETETEASYEEIASQETLMRQAILRHEVSPVIYHWYRKILGRDPAKAEYDLWISRTDYIQGVFNLQQLKTDLMQSPELAARTAEVNFIKAEVTDDLRHYFTLTQEQRLGFASSLGIAAGKLVSLTAVEGESILAWLNSRSLHFGQSAYVALESMLAKAGLTYERRELARRLILVDILTGTLTPLESEDLLISMFALKTVAAFFGLSGEGYAMNYQSLKSLYDAECPPGEEPCQFRAIAHIDGNHYIVVTKITEEEVTFIETGSASPEHLDIHTMSKEEFLASWIDASNPTNQFGYIFSAQPPPEAEFSAQRVTIMDDSKLMRVRGAFFIAIIVVAVVAVAKAVIAAVAATIAAISAIIGGIASGISSILGGFSALYSGVTGIFSGQFFAGLQGLFQGLVSGFGQIASAVFKGIAVFGKTFVDTFALGGLTFNGLQASAGALLKSFSFSGFINGTLVGSGIGLGFQGAGKLLEVMGVSPKISQTLMAGGKIITGAFMLGAGNVAGLGLLSGGSSEFLSLHTNLSPAMSGIIGIGAAALGAFAGGVGSLSGLEALKSVVPHLSMDLATSGLTALGDALKLDPRITALASIPIRAGLGNSIGNFFNINGYNDIIQNIRRDIAGNLVKYSKEIALDALGVPPLAKDLVSGFISGFTASYARQQGVGDSDSGSIATQTVFGKISDTFNRFAYRISEPIAGALSFGAKALAGVGEVTVQGIKNAVNAFSNIFSRKAQEGIRSDSLDIRNAEVTVSGNHWVWKQGDILIDYDAQRQELRELSGDDVLLYMSNGLVDSNGAIFYEKLDYRTAVAESPEGSFRAVYENGRMTEWQYSLADDFGITVYDATDHGWEQSEEWLERGDVEITQRSIEIQGPDEPYVFDGKPIHEMKFTFKTENGAVSKKWRVESAPISQTSSESSPFDPTKELFVLTNGVANFDDFASEYLRNLQRDIIEASQIQSGTSSGPAVDSFSDIIVAPTFGGNDAFANILKAYYGVDGAAKVALLMNDLMSYVAEQKAGLQTLGQQVKNSMEAFFKSLGDEHRVRPLVAVGYSGGFVPVMEAVTNGNAEYNVNAFVALGGATVSIGAEGAKRIVDAVAAFEDLKTARSSETRRAYELAFNAFKTFFGLTGNLVAEKFANAAESFMSILDQLYNLIGLGGLSPATDMFYSEMRSFFQELTSFTWGGDATSGAKMLVNIYGTEDLLNRMPFPGVNIAGHRDELAGFSTNSIVSPLFNIEIEGADHFDYILGVDKSKTGNDHTKNEIVSRFVAELILKVDSPEILTRYLNELVQLGKAQYIGATHWKIFP